MTTYKEAGVDIEAGDQAVKEISKLVKNTFNKNTLIDIGGFGGCCGLFSLTSFAP